MFRNIQLLSLQLEFPTDSGRGYDTIVINTDSTGPHLTDSATLAARLKKAIWDNRITSHFVASPPESEADVAMEVFLGHPNAIGTGRMTFGVGEVVSGIFVLPETPPAGLYMLWRGMDEMVTGWKMILTGDVETSSTTQVAVDQVTGDRETTNLIILITDIGVNGIEILRQGAKRGFFKALDETAELVDDVLKKKVASDGKADAISGERLRKHLSQLEEYGKGGFKRLENGRYRYYGELFPSSKPGEMVGRRVVREWDPVTRRTRTWMETLDANGRVRIVRPETSGHKIHYMFDEFGNFIGTF